MLLPFLWCAPLCLLVRSVVFGGALRCVRRLISRRGVAFVRQPSGLPRLCRGPPALPPSRSSALLSFRRVSLSCCSGPIASPLSFRPR
nr:MAG TPA: hypothetical protein [Caudoviricetes sp.]